MSGGLLLNGAESIASDGWALSAGGLAMEGGVFCRDGFVAHVEVRLMGARLPGTLVMQGARLEGPGPRGVALALDLTLARPPSGTVDLRGAQVSYLHENEHSRPERVELDGFVYGSVKTADANDERHEAVGDRESAARRVAWIRSGPGYNPQPYEQLATWYRKAGHDDDARRVLLAKQRHRRRALSPAARAWGHLLDVTVGYGSRPWLAGVWLLALVLLGTAAFRPAPPTRSSKAKAPRSIRSSTRSTS